MVTDKHKLKYEVCRRGFENSDEVSMYNKSLIIDFVEKKGDKCETGNFPYSYSCMRINCLKWLAKFFDDKDLDKLTHQELLMCGRELRRSTKWKKQYKKKWCDILNSFFAFLCGRDINKLNNLIYDEQNDRVFSVGKVLKRDKKEKPLLTYEEVEKLVSEAKLPHYAYYFAVMFDGGMRIEEFLALRFKDITPKVQDGQEYYEFHIWYGTKNRGESRDIALTMYPNVIKEQLERRKQELGDKYSEDEKVFNYQTNTADSICNKFVKSEIARILKKENALAYHNHSIRHSSATYYYCDLDFSDALLEARFGWGPKSNERREYVQLRNNISKKQISEMRTAHIKVRTNEISYELEKTKEEIKKEREDWSKEMDEFKELCMTSIKGNAEAIKTEYKEDLNYHMKQVEFENMKNQQLFDLILNIAKHIQDDDKMEEIIAQTQKIDNLDFDKFYKSQSKDKIFA